MIQAMCQCWQCVHTLQPATLSRWGPTAMAAAQLLWLPLLVSATSSLLLLVVVVAA
jgi:hypothetical protein